LLLVGDDSDGDIDFKYSHFSDLLDIRDTFRWNVTKSRGSANILNMIGDVGTIMQIMVHSEPENYDMRDETASLNDAFELTLDGVFTDIREFSEFTEFNNIIFPIYFDFENGTIIDNFFIYLDENPDIINLDEGEIVDIERDSNTAYHEVTRTEEGVTKTEKVTWDLTTGVMISAYFLETTPLGILSEVEFTGIGDDSDGDIDFKYSHFSDLLDIRDTFRWNVTKSRGSANILNMIGDVGTIMQIMVLSEPENYDMRDETASLNDAFELTLDGVLTDIREFSEFTEFLNIIFPIYFDFENGTIIDNFFIYLDENPGIINLDEGEIVDIEQDSNTAYHEVTRTEEGVTKTEKVTWDLTTGVMISAYFMETTPLGILSEVEFTGIDVENPTTSDVTSTDGSDNTPSNPLPGMTYIWVITALIAIPIIRKSRNKIY
ncbi:MAG: hypothetical protein ACXAD7_23740, partial [Candidatus Kariarchaeaceae archaeon]